MTAHDPRVTLTEAERDALDGPLPLGGFPDLLDDVSGVVERIIAARLAPIRALAEQWNDTPDYMPSEYDRGRVDQRHDMTGQLYEALDGAEGQGEGVCARCYGTGSIGDGRSREATAWFDGYEKGNLDGYFGTSDERAKSPYADLDPYREDPR